VSEWVNLRQTVSRSVCPVVRRPSGTCDQFFFHLEIPFRHLRVCKFVALSLTRGRVCKLLYNCFWALPEKSLVGRSPAELTALFYCLIWDYTNLEGQVPVFRSHVSAVRNFRYYHWEGCSYCWFSFCALGGGPNRKYRFEQCLLMIRTYPSQRRSVATCCLPAAIK
jgi:hypothetical protein